MSPEEITEIRKKLGVTQERFAYLIGTTTATVNRWENGKTVPSRLSIKELKEIRKNHGSYVCGREELKKS